MAEGAFTLEYALENGVNADIVFHTKEGVDTIPSDQAELMDAVERTLTVLKNLFPGRDKRFGRYLRALFSLSSAGLVGPSAQPQTARIALAVLKDEILQTEGPRIKNGYMLWLGFWAGWTALGAGLLGMGFYGLHGWLGGATVNFSLLGQFAYAWAGSMAGTWISFGWRKSALQFEDLGQVERDFMWPSLRLAYTGLQTVIIGLVMVLGLIPITVAHVSPEHFATSVEFALLLGLFCGFSEMTLPSIVAQHASAVLGKNVEKS